MPTDTTSAQPASDDDVLGGLFGNERDVGDVGSAQEWRGQAFTAKVRKTYHARAIKLAKELLAYAPTSSDPKIAAIACRVQEIEAMILLMGGQKVLP